MQAALAAAAFGQQTRGIAMPAAAAAAAPAATAAVAPHMTVVGAGLVGLTTAHALLRTGFRVTVVDRQPGAANECSFANAALLMTSYSRPKTATPMQLLRWATSRKEPVHISWRALLDPRMTSFGLRFLLGGPQTSQKIFETSQVTDELAGISVDLFNAIRSERGLDVKTIDGGLLMFFESEAKLQGMIDEAEETFTAEQRKTRYRVVSAEECVELEPMLASKQSTLAGGVFWPHDRTVCSLSFSQKLAESLACAGVEFRFDEELVGVTGSSGNAFVSLSSSKDIQTDGIVVTGGVESGSLLKRLDSSSPPVPLYGMRGHSLTVDVSHTDPSGLYGHHIHRSLCDGDTMAFFSPLPSDSRHPGRKLLRIAAFGDFDGWGYGPGAVRQWRVDQLIQHVHRVFGSELLSSKAKEALSKPAPARTSPGYELCPEADATTRWCGLRPMSPDGLPVVGRVSNACGVPLFVNAGHGALGWTLSPVTAELLALQVAKSFPGKMNGTSTVHGERLSSLASHLDPHRFRWSNVVRKAARMVRRVPGL